MEKSQMHKTPIVRLLSLAAALSFMACGSSSSTNNGPAGLADYVAQVSNLDGSITALLKTGSPPVGTGSVASASASGVAIPGGSRQVTVTSTASFDTVIIAVDGVDGYYELTGLTSGTSAIVVVTLGQSVPSTFDMEFGAGTGSSFGTLGTLPIILTTVGTGDVQVNVSWDLDVDVDLHVIEPGGAEIYYGNSYSATGGTLDLDSNPACSLDHKKSENITWPSGQAPHGTYTVRVDYYEACVTGTVNYVVTVNASGQAPQTFQGTFTATDADGGSAGSGRDITTFTF